MRPHRLQRPTVPFPHRSLPIKKMQRRLMCGDGDSSVLQPAWHPSGALFYLTDERGFYALQRFEGGASKTVLSVGDADLGGSAPGWAFGQQGYTF